MESDIRYLIEQGKKFFRAEAYKKAEAVFLKVLAGKKEFADVYNMLGVIYHQTGQFSKAIEYFNQALKINPRYTEALINLSVLYNDLGEYKQAKSLIEKSKKVGKNGKEKLDPFIKGKLANKHAEAGDMYRGVGLFEAASYEYEKALELAPHFSDIRNKLGISLREQGKKKEAIHEFGRIVKENPHFTEAQIQLGVTLFGMGEKQKARKIWLALVKSHPRHELVKMYLRLAEDGPAKRK